MVLKFLERNSTHNTSESSGEMSWNSTLTSNKCLELRNRNTTYYQAIPDKKIISSCIGLRKLLNQEKKKEWKQYHSLG